MVGVNLGVGFNAFSGTPLTPLAANPVYENAGEIPEAPRGSGIETVDGFLERTPWLTGVDLHADYQLPIGGERRVLLLADVFNVFNQREPIDYDNYTQVTFPVPKPRLRPGHRVPGSDSSARRTPLRVLTLLRRALPPWTWFPTSTAIRVQSPASCYSRNITSAWQNVATQLAVSPR